MPGQPAPSQFALGLIVCALALVVLAESAPAPSGSVALQRAPARPLSRDGVRALRAGERLDLNHAEVGDLVLLPGVGPKLAQRIVAERTRRGAFGSVDDLRSVKGVGPEILARVRALVTVSGASSDRTATSHSR